MSRVLVFTAYGGPETQQVQQRPLPAPAAGQIAITVKAAGVNPVDWKIRRGLIGERRRLPAEMGSEAAGVVTAVGEGVEGFALGDEVLGIPTEGYGAFAEQTLLDAVRTVLKPEEISFAAAAALPVAGWTAYDVTHQIELKPGQSVLILGAGGGVGLMAAQIGKVHQFQVIGVAGGSKRQLVESTGATFVESGDGALERARAVAPDGVDLVIDLVGGQALRDIAGIAKRPEAVISTADAHTVRELGGVLVARTTEGLEKITEVAQYGLVDPQVSAYRGLDQAARALAEVETGHATGKVIIEP